MSKLKVLFGAFVMAMCSLKAQAQMDVYDTTMSGYDVASLKGGEWFEMETVSEMGGTAMPANKSKTACVKADADNVWIEVTSMDMVTCYQVSKKDRKITKAWMGKAGEEGKECTVKAVPAAPASDVETTGTMTGSKDKQKIAGKEIDCIKVENDLTTKMSGKETKSKSTMWYSKEHPFKMFIDEKATAASKIKQVGEKPEGNYVKMYSEMPEYKMKTTMTVTGWGTDAKPTLKMK